MLVWDNQQETSWFIGILEGEGSCYLSKRGNHKIVITNTDDLIIKSCVSFLTRKTISFIINEQTPKIKRYKKIYNIIISERNNCYTLIKMLGIDFQCRYQEFIDKLNLGSSTTKRDVTLTSDLYWLVGIFEAEGSLGLNLDHENYYYPDISIKNTKINIIEKIAITLHNLGLSWHTSEYVDGDPKHKKIYSIRIRGMKRCYRFLDQLKNLWKSDHYSNRSNLIFEFLNSRLSRNQKEPYTLRERQIYQILKLKI